jgi:uncharacterized protein (DUF2236 family)
MQGEPGRADGFSRLRYASGVIVGKADLEASLDRARAVAAAAHADPRAGIHGPGSAAWRLGRESILFAGGGRAALLQLAHPAVAYAIDQHSTTRDDVVGRFQRTFELVFAIVFGDLDHAIAAARRVHDIHRRIVGTIPIDVGAFRAGARYHANDADALRWVHATLIDTVVRVTELVRGPLSTRRKDAYVRDSHQFARMFGIPEAMLPADWAAFSAYVDGMLASGAIAVAPPAREMAAFLLGRGGGRVQTPLGRWVERVTAALLPPRLRDELGLQWSFADAARVRLAAAAVRPGYAVMPPALRWLPAYQDARRRIAGRPPSALARLLDRGLSQLAGRAAGRT